MTETLMIKKLKNHDEEAFDYCYDTYKNLVYFQIIKVVKNRELTEELVQDTFLKMYQNIEKFDGKFFKAWLLKIANNTAISEIRKKKETIEYNDNVISEEVISSFAHNDILLDLKAILSADEFIIVIYRIIYNMKTREVAEALDLPIGTVSWKYNEALKKAKKYFKEEKE